MPVAMVQEWTDGGNDTTNYDAIVKTMDVIDNPPEGCLVHTAGFLPDGSFRVFDVWESREHFERFMQERLMPAIQEVAGDAGAGNPPTMTIYELHGFQKA